MTQFATCSNSFEKFVQIILNVPNAIIELWPHQSRS
uniref:Uncharacterized protein n=1 Tax=Rhizophora mucronata TaxID=61149 RepID=A0A2P2Q8W5_RHIMU